MIHESLLGEKRWDILEEISFSGASPSQIAEKIQTSVSYVSQQLKILEVAHLIKKTKIQTSEKGKPRSLYNLKNELAQINILENGIAIKKQIQLTETRKALLNIWTLKDEETQAQLEQIFSELKTHLDQIQTILFSEKNDEITIITKNENKIKPLTKKYKIKFKITSDKTKINFKEKLIPLYDPETILIKGRLGEDET